MKHLILLIALFVHFLPAFGQATIEESIAAHIVPLKSNNDFEAMDEILKDKRLVILGEASHFAGSTFKIKTNLVKHLIYNLGFDVLGFECGFFLESLLMPEYAKEITGEEFNFTHIIYTPVWHTEECKPILDDINDGKISVFGFDIQPSFTGMQCFELLLKNIDKNIVDGVDWEKMQTVYDVLNFPSSIEQCTAELDELYYIEQIASIKNQLLRQKQKQPHNVLIDYALQGVKIFKEQFANIKMGGSDPVDDSDYEAIIAGNRLRDKMMADNIIWYLENNPDKKMVVWCASFHGARDLSQTVLPEFPNMYFRTPLMGEYLSEKYGDQLYSIAISSRDHTHPDCLESVIARDYDTDFGFIDFVPLRYDDNYFNIPFKSNVIGTKTGKFMQVFDAIYFLRSDKWSTLLKEIKWFAFPSHYQMRNNNKSSEK